MMRKINLYKYGGEDGSTIITPIQRTNKDEPYKYRLIADEGKVLYDGEKYTSCIDVKSMDVNLWKEVDEFLMQTRKDILR